MRYSERLKKQEGVISTSVYSNTDINICGSKGDLFAALVVIREYMRGVNGVSFETADWITADEDNGFSLSKYTSAKKIAAFVKNLNEPACIEISEMEGPYGRFGSLEDVSIMEDILRVTSVACSINVFMRMEIEIDGTDDSYSDDGVGKDEGDSLELSQLFSDDSTTPDQFMAAAKRIIKKAVGTQSDWDSDEEDEDEEEDENEE